MDSIFKEIEQFVSCFSCGGQSLPPYKLCSEGHVACPACIKYRRHCVCYSRFLQTSNTTLDWLVSAMKLRCKYRALPIIGSPGQIDCDNGWYTVDELRDHYRTSCTKNWIMCPMTKCGFRGRRDTITEHYDAEHNPETRINSEYDSYRFQLRAERRWEGIVKIFNGYHLFSVQPRRHEMLNPQLSMQNINPADRLRYTYNAKHEPHQKMFNVTVSLVETYGSPTSIM